MLLKSVEKMINKTFFRCNMLSAQHCAQSMRQFPFTATFENAGRDVPDKQNNDISIDIASLHAVNKELKKMRNELNEKDKTISVLQNKLNRLESQSHYSETMFMSFPDTMQSDNENDEKQENGPQKPFKFKASGSGTYWSMYGIFTYIDQDYSYYPTKANIDSNPNSSQYIFLREIYFFIGR
eukprot:88950_1